MKLEVFGNSPITWFGELSKDLQGFSNPNSGPGPRARYDGQVKYCTLYPNLRGFRI